MCLFVGKGVENQIWHDVIRFVFQVPWNLNFTLKQWFCGLIN
jgi:hypothetical protein